MRKIRIGDLQLMYAVVKKKKVSPVRLIVEHWLIIPNLIGVISCTSLITRIVVGLNLIEDANLEYIEEHRTYVGYDHCRHAHVLKI